MNFSSQIPIFGMQKLILLLCFALLHVHSSYTNFYLPNGAYVCSSYSSNYCYRSNGEGLKLTTVNYQNNGCGKTFYNVGSFTQTASSYNLIVFGVPQVGNNSRISFKSYNQGQAWEDCYYYSSAYPYFSMCGNHGCCVASMFQAPYTCVTQDQFSYSYDPSTTMFTLYYQLNGYSASSLVNPINSTYGFVGWKFSGINWQSDFEYTAAIGAC